MRLLGFFLLLVGALAITGEILQIAFPTAHWFFETSRTVPGLSFQVKDAPGFLNWLFDHSRNLPAAGLHPKGPFTFLWFGWLSSILLLISSSIVLIRSFFGGPPNPITARRIKRFREIKRGYYSLLILIALAGIASLDQAVVGKRALAVRYNGNWTFPAFQPQQFKNKDFGVVGSAAEGLADYRKLKRTWKEASARKASENLVIMPLIPYDPADDTLPARSRELRNREGVYCESGSTPFWGLAAKYFDVAESRMHIRYTVRNGLLTGPVEGWDREGNTVYSATYQDGRLIDDQYSGTATKEEFLALESSSLRAVKYHPAPPIPDERNWLGTNSQGFDVLAYLYGGLQVNFKAAIIYLPIVYLIGITLGMMMGYFGSWFDLILQRIIEIFANVPFLFVVIILSSMVPEKFKGLPVILSILTFFGWMGIAYLMRTAAYRDRERDYIAAAKVLGAGTPRILFRHLMPNTLAIIVTLVPFTMSALIFALTSLDYLGFGLPSQYATWGRLLTDGLSNLSAPWLVTSTFVVLVSTLTLITFVGEAVREAFDPKKFTYYR